MKVFLLTLGLFATATGGLVLLLGNTNGKHCGPCAGPPAPAAEAPVPAESSDGCCEACKACSTSGKAVYDVADLKAGFAAVEPTPFVSFDEPPLAKPKGSLTAVSYQSPKGIETLPAPREAK